MCFENSNSFGFIILPYQLTKSNVGNKQIGEQIYQGNTQKTLGIIIFTVRLSNVWIAVERKCFI